jgi:hypothetical protein
MAETEKTIVLDRSRCIFLNNVIYFSNYYLNEVISETEKYPKPIKVNFNDDKFMNEGELEENAIPNNINEKMKVQEITEKPDVTKYTRINLELGLTNDDLKKSVEDIFAELGSIFNKKEKVIQYLKYNGYWCSKIKHTPFNNRNAPDEQEEVEEDEQRGGNKNTTRRNGTNNNPKSKSKKKN